VVTYPRVLGLGGGLGGRGYVGGESGVGGGGVGGGGVNTIRALTSLGNGGVGPPRGTKGVRILHW